MAVPARSILLVSHDYAPIGGSDGHATYQIARAMARLGRTPFVLTAAFRGLAHVEHGDGVTVRRVFAFRRRAAHASVPEMLAFTAAACLAAPGLARHWQVDAVLAFSGLPSGPVGWRLKRARGLPYAIALQGGDVPGFAAAGLARRLAQWHRMAGDTLRHLWADADAVIAHSESLARLAHRHAPEQRISVIPAGADVDGIVPKDSYATGGTVKLLFVGRLVPQKGLDVLIEALAKLPPAIPWQLDLAGDGPEWTALAGLAARHSIADRVRVHGWMKRADVMALLRAADVFVLPAREDGLPTAVLEAMAAGLPVIGTSVAGMADAVADGETGVLVATDDVAALTAAVLRLAQDAAAREAMGRAGRARAEAQFSWTAVAQAWLDVLDRIAQPS